ncbi:MAG: hypothetical protein ACLPQP_27700, partial [Mycobacterium sp.]
LIAQNKPARGRCRSSKTTCRPPNHQGWVIVITAAAGLLALTRATLDHVRNIGWQHDINDLLCHGGGYTNTQP